MDIMDNPAHLERMNRFVEQASSKEENCSFSFSFHHLINAENLKAKFTMVKRKQYSLNGKNKHPLDVDFVQNDEEKEKIRTVSYLEMFRYASAWDKFLLYLGILCAMGTGILQPMNTLLFGKLTGDIIEYAASLYNMTMSAEDKKKAENDFLDGINYFAVMNTAVGAGMFILSFISTITFTYTASRQVFTVKSTYLSKIFNQDISWYDVHQTGDLSSRMSEDLYKFEEGIGEKVPLFFHFQVVFVTALIIALVKGWELALICLTSLPATLIALGVVAFLTTKFAKKELDAYAAAGTIAEETLSAIRTVLAFSGQQKEIQRYDKNLVFARDNNIKRSMLTAIGMSLLWFMIYASYALAFWYGVRLLLEQRGMADPVYTPGNMVTVFFSVMTGSMNFGISSPYIEAFSTSKAAASKIFSVIDNIPIINLSKGKGEKPASIKGNIKFRNVKFHYPSRTNVPILQGLSMEINEGDTVALVGSSGCGKSTVIQLIQRFYDPTSGEISLDGRNLKDVDLTWLRNHIGVVGQEPVLFGTTIMENIKYGNLNATEDDVISAAKKANAHTFINTLPNGYNTLVGERGAQLSGGQKQRIAIARALVRNPAILLLDEATSALDYTSEAKVQAALDSASAGCTTIIVAHRLSTIRGANRIIVLNKGNVVEQGTHEELMALKKEYHGLVMAQLRSAEGVEEFNKNKRVIHVDEDEMVENMVKEQKVKEDEVIMDNEKDASLLEVLKMNSQEWPQILLGSIASALLGSSMPLFSVLFGSILGTLASGDSDYVRSESNKYCLYFIYVGIGSMVSTFLQMYMFGVAGERMTERIRSKMFKAMINQEVGFYDDKANNVGTLCARLSGDASKVQGATGQRLGTILQSLTTFVVAISLSLYYDYRLGLLTAAFTPFMFLAMYFERRNTSGLTGNSEGFYKSNKIAVEGVGNIRTVASLGLEERFHHLYTSELEPYYKSVQRNVHWRGLVFGLARSLPLFTYSASMFYGGRLVVDGMPYERVFKVSQALIMGTTSIANSLAFSPNLALGIESAKNVKKLLNRVPRIKDSPNSQTIEKVKGNFDFAQVGFSYPTRPEALVLRGLNLNIPQGKTIALVGHSGCGKSTVIQLIERFYDPLSGEVKLDGNELRDIKMDSLRSHIGIVSQEPNLFNKTIAENIAYGDNNRTVDMNEIIEAAKNANIHKFIVELPQGYETKLGEKAVQLSGGQKQRIAIARALVRNPKVLLLDEATSALDTESEKIVQHALDQAKKGRTCVTIAHRLTTIQDADVICVIDRGVVAESGTHQELLDRKGLYYQLQQTQK